jgi:hypothetical protein
VIAVQLKHLMPNRHITRALRIESSETAWTSSTGSRAAEAERQKQSSRSRSRAAEAQQQQQQLKLLVARLYSVKLSTSYYVA